MPPEVLRLAAVPAGTLVYFVLRRRRRIALRNLDIAFRSALAPGEKRRIARASFANALLTFAGPLARERWVRRRGGELFAITEAEDRLLAGPHPRGLAILSAHAGDWEMLHRYLLFRGLPIVAVTRGVANRIVDRELARLRAGHGGRVVPKAGALRQIRAALARREPVGLMADQNCPARKRFFAFFGVPASTYTEYARVFARLAPTILFVACLRERGGRFRIRVQDLGTGLEAVSGASPREERARCADEIVRRYLRAVEDLAREHPEHYLWMHRRWKSRPSGAPWLYGDLGRPLDLRLLDGEG